MPDAVSPPRPHADPTKQAVILVHGMGEPTPMETLRGFVQTMWVENAEIDARRPTETENPVWWKPDVRTGSMELSRITTRGAQDGMRTDFYEFYWGDLTDANTLIHLKDWFWSLLWRRHYQVPSDVFRVWVVLWAATIVFGGLAIWKGLTAAFPIHPMPFWAQGLFAAGALAYGAMIAFVLAYFGDVARYVRAKPPNIAARRNVRERGLALLRELSKGDQYNRIVLVGHSLGTIVTYDLLKLFWAECEDAREMQVGDPLHQAFLRLEKAAAALPEAPSDVDLEVYRAAQSEVFEAMRTGRKQNWLISDLVTVGSPLSHAEFLMAHDKQAFETGKRERRFPTSPPQLDQASFLYSARSGATVAHHATPFAAVRWTNIYDPAEPFFLFGDIISGPVRSNFGPGIIDIAVRIEREGWGPLRRLFTHTAYWSRTGAGDPQLPLLRTALDLLRRPPSPPGAAHEAKGPIASASASGTTDH